MKKGLSMVLTGAMALSTACAGMRYNPRTAPEKAEKRSESSWTFLNGTLAATSTAALVADWGQSLDRRRLYPRHGEANPLLGAYPSRARINTYFGIVIGANLLFGSVLKNPWRDIYFGAITALEGYVVGRNISRGLNISF